MSRPKIEPPFPGGAVPLLGNKSLPTQPAIVVKGENGQPVAFPCTAAHLLTDHAKGELWNLVVAAVNAVLAARGLGDEPVAPAVADGETGEGKNTPPKLFAVQPEVAV